MDEDRTHIVPMNRALLRTFRNALRVSGPRPSLSLFVLRTIYRQWKAARLRKRWLERGVPVPPYMIASVTERCNLRCKGCYAQAHLRSDLNNEEMTLEDWARILQEAQSLGISVVILAGGEPLARRGLLELLRSYPKMTFLLFTNGLLLDEAGLSRLKKQRNIIPIVSLEGPAAETDSRRGEGVFEHLRGLFGRFRESGVFYGTSITVTRENISRVLDPGFIRSLTADGCRLFFFIEYVPIKEGTEDLVLTDEQQEALNRASQQLNEQFKSIFIVFPGDETLYGGCLAAGRGFIHVNSGGGLEPCPFAPFSDVNLKNASLGEALRSKFLQAIRADHDRLVETQGGCALWSHRDWVRETLEETSR